MTTNVEICEPKGFLTMPDINDDNGLGFGQGSLDGMFNQYYTSYGFHRPRHPEVDRGLRNRFNLKGFRGSYQYNTCSNPYKCHYDPAPYFDEYKLPEHSYNFNNVSKPSQNESTPYDPETMIYKTTSYDVTSHINTVVCLILIIIALFLWFV